MALLRNRNTQESRLVEAELLIGRSPRAGLRIERPYVSSHHATLRWNGKQWQLRDLGSRNGTFLNGSLLSGGVASDVAQGDLMTFGRESEAWEITDDSAPLPMLIPCGSGNPVIIDKEVIGIPNDDEPSATAFRGVDGLWRLESADGQLTTIESGQQYRAGGEQWRFSFPEIVGPTHSLGELSPPRAVRLIFAVSRDEEYIELCAQVGGQAIELGSRAHNYLLLILARSRIADQGNGLPEGSCGWMYLEHVLNSLHIERTQLNIDIFRVRQHFAKAGLQDAINVIERRPATKQLRLGTDQIEIRSL